MPVCCISVRKKKSRWCWMIRMKPVRVLPFTGPTVRSGLHFNPAPSSCGLGALMVDRLSPDCRILGHDLYWSFILVTQASADGPLFRGESQFAPPKKNFFLKKKKCWSRVSVIVYFFN